MRWWDGSFILRLLKLQQSTSAQALFWSLPEVPVSFQYVTVRKVTVTIALGMPRMTILDIYHLYFCSLLGIIFKRRKVYLAPYYKAWFMSARFLFFFFFNFPTSGLRHVAFFLCVCLWWFDNVNVTQIHLVPGKKEVK